MFPPLHVDPLWNPVARGCATGFLRVLFSNDVHKFMETLTYTNLWTHRVVHIYIETYIDAYLSACIQLSCRLYMG